MRQTGGSAILAMAVAALSLIGPGVARQAAAQQEPMRPSAGSPFSITDAFNQEAGQLQLETYGAYEREMGSNGRETYELLPQLEYGLTERLELRLDGRYGFGNGSRAGRGDVTPGLLYRVTEEQGWLPAVAVLGEVEIPFGASAGLRGETVGLTGILTKTTGRGPGAWGFHLNAGWLARPDPGEEERRHRYRFAAGVSHVVAPDTALVAVYSQERQEVGERDLLLVEGGLEHRLGSSTRLAILAGAGLNRDSPALRLVAGVKLEFGGR